MKKINLTHVKQLKENKNVCRWTTVAAVVALLGWGYYVTTRPVVGVIDFTAVQTKAKVYQSVLAEQKKYEEEIRVRVVADSKDIEKDAKDLEAKKDKMKAEEYQRKAREIQRRAFKVQEKYRPTLERVMLASQIALKQAEKEIALSIEKTAEQKGLRVILPMNNALYASKQADMTDAFVKNLDKMIQTVSYPDPAKIGQ